MLVKKAKEALSKEGWADPYDIVVYNICHAHEKDNDFLNKLTKVHKEGKPAVAIHCTMHSYHWKLKADENGDKEWNKLLGVRSPNHGPKAAITVTKNPEVDHKVYKGMPDTWKTPKGELYNIDKVYPTCKVLAYGENGNKKQGKQPLIWVNQYGKAKVFGTTLGHHNETMQSKEFLQVLSNGIEWAATSK